MVRNPPLPFVRAASAATFCPPVVECDVEIGKNGMGCSLTQGFALG